MTDAASIAVLSRFVLEHWTEPVVVLDAAGYVIEVNHAASADPQWDAAEPFRRQTRDAEVVGFLERLRATGHAKLEVSASRADTRQPPLALRGVAIDGFFVVTLERSRALMALEAENRQLRRVETLGLLTARIVHDINNLLTPLALLSRDLVTEMSTQQSASLAREVEVTVQRAASLLQSVLRFARPKPARTERMTLNAAVLGLRPLLNLLIGPNIELVLALGEPLPVYVDRVQLEQTVLNLASNAKHAMSDGGQLRITTTSTSIDPGPGADASSATHAVLIVSDTGTGMTHEVQQRAFDAFFTTRADRGGTGIGLSSVQHFVNEHHGLVTLASEAGRGTSIAIHLPIAERGGHGGARSPSSD
jgi:signal transduction histidine kinase